MREARFICILDSMLYHLLPIGNNFSIDKLCIFVEKTVRVPGQV